MARERIPGFINCPCGDGSDFRFRYGEECERALEPLEQISDGFLCIGLMGNSQINPEKLQLTERDRQEIVFQDPQTKEEKKLTYPGKSSFIVVEPNFCDREFIHSTVENLLGSVRSDRHDHLYVARVRDLEKAGWVAYHAPRLEEGVINHVRLVAKRTIAEKVDPTDEDIENLRNAFKIVPNLHG